MGVACPGLRSKTVDPRAWWTAVKGCGEVRVVFLKAHRICGPGRAQVKVQVKVQVKGKDKDKDKACARVWTPDRRLTTDRGRGHTVDPLRR